MIEVVDVPLPLSQPMAGSSSAADQDNTVTGATTAIATADLLGLGKESTGDSFTGMQQVAEHIHQQSNSQQAREGDDKHHQASSASSTTCFSSSIKVVGTDRRDGSHRHITLPLSVVNAMQQLGMNKSVGFLAMMRAPGHRHSSAGEYSDRLIVCCSTGSGSARVCTLHAQTRFMLAEYAGTMSHGSTLVVVDADASSGGSHWMPLTVQFGVPLYSLSLCKEVCARAREGQFLSPDSRAAHQSGQQLLQSQLWHLIQQYGAVNTSDVNVVNASVVGPVELPLNNLLFDGTNIQVMDFSGCIQGAGCMVVDA